MNTNLRELYQDLRERRPLSPNTLKQGMRIGVLYQGSIHIITIAATGPLGGYTPHAVKGQLIAVAKIAPHQPALGWDNDGVVHLLRMRTTREATVPDLDLVTEYRLQRHELESGLGCDPYSGQIWLINGEERQLRLERLKVLEESVGVLWPYKKAIWEPLVQGQIVPVSKEEKRVVWRESPLEKLADDNTGGVVTAQNKWFYER